MPTYDYRCSECGHEFEEFQSMSAEMLKTCPKCGKDTLKRAMGTGAGTIFKGGGFYQTDYKNTGGEKKAEKAAGAKKTEPKADKPAETKKSDTGSDSKPTKSDPKKD